MLFWMIIISAWVISLVLFTYKASKIYFEKGKSRGLGQCNNRLSIMLNTWEDVREDVEENDMIILADVSDTMELVSSCVTCDDFDMVRYHIQKFVDLSVIYGRRTEKYDE